MAEARGRPRGRTGRPRQETARALVSASVVATSRVPLQRSRRPRSRALAGLPARPATGMRSAHHQRPPGTDARERDGNRERAHRSARRPPGRRHVADTRTPTQRRIPRHADTGPWARRHRLATRRATDTPPAVTGRTLVPDGGANSAWRRSNAARISCKSASSATSEERGSSSLATRPSSSPPTARAADTASSTSLSSLRARSSSASPARVSSTRWVDLRSSSQPTSCSSPRICRLSAG